MAIFTKNGLLSKFLLLHIILLFFAFNYSEYLGLLSFFAFVPFLFFVDREMEKETPLLKISLKIFLYSLLMNALVTWWFFDIFPLTNIQLKHGFFLTNFSLLLEWLLFITALSIPYTLFGVLIQFLSFVKNTYFYPFLLASMWVLLEALKVLSISIVLYGDRSLLGLHYSYYSIAYTASSVKIINNLLAIGGIYGLSFFILTINRFIYLALRRKEKLGNLFFLCISLIALFSVFSGYIQYSNHINKNNTDLEVTLLNTNLLPANTPAASMLKATTVIDYLLSSSSTAQIIIIPENINIIGSPSLQNNFFREKLLVGSLTKNDEHMSYYDEPQGNGISFYKKQLLMPITEYEIFLTSIFSNKKNIPLFQEDILKIHSKIVLGGVHIFTSICSENISPALFRKETRAGAEVMINLASHAIFNGSKLLYRQTMAVNKARAIENGRYLVVASNYSPSYILNESGKVVKEFSATNEVAATDAKIKKISYITPYVRCGDYFIILSILILLVTLIWRKNIKHYK